jgi:RNA binding exosome subunit
MSDKTDEKMEKVLERLESLPLSDMLVQFLNSNQKEMSRMGNAISHLENTVERQFSEIRILKSMLKEAGISDVSWALKSQMEELENAQQAEREESRW